MQFRIIDGCPCPASIAPYVAILLADARQQANSIYRGDDAQTLLHAHAKHTQAEIHALYPGISNPPGYSSHELRSDGSPVYGRPRGARLEEWQVGVDSGTNSARDKARIEVAASARGWVVVHPYSRGVEAHHWNFARRPRPKGPRTLAKLIRVRRQLPRR